ncbi:MULTISPECIES: DUF1028 domain-containing protein [Terrilactibacillus]|uniref:DUF1028 domain-containing protein n=2 Tax=Terrilactibacillus TaxID=1795633 RepID=A0A6N8CRG0_9BACI|nr:MULTISPECIES: DUF1028 domain-containing protein [Terrilactibacillus]MTT32829.1 DUF1028 domain-containing protein [Terrilactibacillus tamarindi]
MKKIPNDVVATFSIVGYDPEAQEWGVAVQSKFLGVGAVVPFAKAGVGAVATQSYANTSYGPKGLELMEKGYSAEEVLQELIKHDDDRELRQFGLIDAKGRSATYTGAKCFDWAGGITGEHFTAQGNILISEKTVEAMGETFLKTEGSLADRLIEALDAGQSSGGDSRGKQSAALLVVREKGGYGGFNDRAIDLRVDDHPEPIKELKRIYQLQQLYFSKSKEEDIVELDDTLKQNIIQQLFRLNYLSGEESVTNQMFEEALTSFIHTENFEEREQPKGKVDLAVVRFMREK